MTRKGEMQERGESRGRNRNGVRTKRCRQDNTDSSLFDHTSFEKRKQGIKNSDTDGQ